jgi:hypothetical protein
MPASDIGATYAGGRRPKASTLPDSRAAKKWWRINGDAPVVRAFDIMRILFLVFQATPKSYQDDPVFQSRWIFGSWQVDQTADQAEVRRDLNVARFIDLMLPISFKPLLKYLRRCSLVNFGKLLEGKRVGHTYNVGINGL